MKRRILLVLFLLLWCRPAHAILDSTSSGGAPSINSCSPCNSINVTPANNTPGSNIGAIAAFDAHYTSTTSCATITAPTVTGTIATIQGYVNAACSAANTPFPCCTGSGTGSCGPVAGFQNVAGSTQYLIDVTFATNQNYAGGLFQVTGTTNFNGTYAGYLTGPTHFQLYTATSPNSSQETTGTMKFGEAWSLLKSSGSVSDGGSGNNCAWLYYNPSGAVGGDSTFSLSNTADQINSLGMAVQHVALTGTISDATAAETDSAGTPSTTIVGPAITTAGNNDDVISVIYSSNISGFAGIGLLSNDLTGSNSQLAGGNSGIQLPCIEYGSTQSQLVYPFTCDGGWTTRNWGVLEVNSPLAGVQAAETVTAANSNNWIVLRAALKPDFLPQTVANPITGLSITGTGTPGLTGGGSLSTGSNSIAGTMTSLAASSNVLTPGFTCAHDVVCSFQDDTTVGGILVTARSATTITFSATASDTGDYLCGCR